MRRHCARPGSLIFIVTVAISANGLCQLPVLDQPCILDQMRVTPTAMAATSFSEDANLVFPFMWDACRFDSYRDLLGFTNR